MVHFRSGTVFAVTTGAPTAWNQESGMKGMYLIRTGQIKANADTRHAEKAISAEGLARSGMPANRGQIYHYLSSLVQQGWNLEHLDRQGALLNRPVEWRKLLFIAGFLLLPLMGFGLLLWVLALYDAISGSKETLFVSFEGIREGKKPLRGRLNTLQHFSLAGFGMLFMLWLVVALPVLMPGMFQVVLPLPEGFLPVGKPPGEIKMGAVVPVMGFPYATGAVLTSTASPTLPYPLNSPTATMTPLMPLDPTATPTITATPTATATPRPDPADWMNWPVLPEFSYHWLEVFEDGIEKGNNPQAFSVVGDCQSVPYLFMGMYDGSWYSTDSLQQSQRDTIEFFAGSFSRYSMTIIDGGTAASMLVTGWANRNWCDINESPLQCELRLHRPSFVIVNIGTHWTGRNGDYLRSIVETILEAGALPILATKGDNLEGDHSINYQIAQIASEYDIPLWNLWRAVQDLPGYGLDPYRQGGYMYFTSSGLEVRRLTALQVLDLVRQAVD